MKVLLVGNYELSRQTSMQRFSGLLCSGLRAAGHEVRLMRPPVLIGKVGQAGALEKWLGYADRFILFPPLLKQAAWWADLVHICDHSNSMYVKYVLNRPHVVTCHDMLAVRSALGEIPENPTSWTGQKLQQMILNGLRQAAHIVCVSEATRQELIRIAAVQAHSVSTIYNGLNFPYSPLGDTEARSQIAKFGIGANDGFILHVGSNSWYKNRLGVLKILGRVKTLPQGKTIRLVMAGWPMTHDMRAFLREHRLQDDVVELVNPSNEDLKALYSSADLLLFPSLHEGFGWPIIEAQACGCPVVTSNRMPMTEIGGEAAIYVDPDDVDSAAAVVAPLLRKRSQPCESSVLNAKRFETADMILQYTALFEKLVKDSSNAITGNTARAT